MAWQPIESAPKDGTRVMLADAEWTDIGRWRIESQLWMDDDDAGWTDPFWPTHWMPLPPPPGSPDEFVRIPRLD
jgi:hypothetical protein